MNKLIKIADVKYLGDYILSITFDDGCVKSFDFAEVSGFNGIAEALRDVDYFMQARIAPDQRRLSWNNGYDCCADWLRYFAKDVHDEWASVDETVGLLPRMKIAQQHQHRNMQYR